MKAENNDRQKTSSIYKSLKGAVGLFRRSPILSNEGTLFLITVLLMLPLIILLHRSKGECTCEDQIEDQVLTSSKFKQNKQVQAYLKTRDNTVMCEARRKELLKKLEHKKQRTLKM